jgi:protein gp37
VAGHPYEQGFDLRFWPERLEQPAKWRKPRRIFVNSMSDLYHEGVAVDYIAKVFDAMESAPHHTFQVLTKRPGRMASVMRRLRPTPLQNVWLGTSIEVDRYSWRAEKLRETPAFVRFLSLEPLLGPLPSLDLSDINWVIVGGESGHHARALDAGWVRSLRDQCNEARVAFFFKQWGGRTPKAGGRELDGQTWDQYPAALPA